MIKVYAAGNVDDVNDEVLYTKREEAELAAVLQFEWDEQTDSANYSVTFATVDPVLRRELLGSDLDELSDDVRFLMVENGPKPHYYVRELTVYDSTDERYVDTDPTEKV